MPGRESLNLKLLKPENNRTGARSRSRYELKVTGANAPMGRVYCSAFNMWICGHGFERMEKSPRSAVLEMHENVSAIETWRSTLTDKQRRRLQGPLQNVRRWKRETGQVQKQTNQCGSESGSCLASFCFLYESLAARPGLTAVAGSTGAGSVSLP